MSKRKVQRQSDTVADKQRKNLHFTESLGSRLPDVRGVSIVKALSFDLIQLLNRVSMEPKE